MEPAWRPISRIEFDELVAEQVEDLDQIEREILDSCRIEPRQAMIRRSEKYGDERVWLIAERDGRFLYLDDVEWGWNWSKLDEGNRILEPAGSQGELQGMFI